MRIKPFIFGILVLVIYFGTLQAFKAAGIWSISGKVTSGGQAVQPSADDVNTIKGWMTLEQISTAYNVPLAELLQQFNLPADTPASTPIKDLESEVFSVSNLRTWLQSRAQPAETGSTPLPAATATPTPAVVPTAVLATPQPTQHVAPEKMITGKTTFQELLDWGVPEEAIRQIIGGDLPSQGTVIKDYVTGQGLSFGTIKAALQAEVDKIK